MSDPLGVAYVYESTPETLLFNYQYIRRLHMDMTIDHNALALLNHLHFKPRMYIFCRNVRTSRDPIHDILKLWVGDERIIRDAHAPQIANLEKVRSGLLGDEAELKGGEVNGTALERSGRGNGNGQGSWCITLGQSVEYPKGIGHPAGNVSQAHQSNDPMLGYVRSLLKVRYLTLNICFHLDILHRIPFRSGSPA